MKTELILFLNRTHRSRPPVAHQHSTLVTSSEDQVRPPTHSATEDAEFRGCVRDFVRPV